MVFSRILNRCIKIANLIAGLRSFAIIGETENEQYIGCFNKESNEFCHVVAKPSETLPSSYPGKGRGITTGVKRK